MVWENPERVELAIRRLTKELGEIDKFFYGSAKDRVLHLGMLERKRDDVVRSLLMQLHTSIEDLMTSMLFSQILGTDHGKHGKKSRTNRGRALERMLVGGGSLGFDMKLNLAVVVGLFNSSTRDKLKELNAIRNKCSHNWLLNVAVRRGKNPKGTRPLLLNFRGKDLHKVAVLKDFSAEYGRIYYRLFAKAIS